MPALEQLTWVNDRFTAHVLEAKLASEGIDCQLRGAIAGPYALTVGDMARVDLYVPEEQLEDAKLVLLAGEIDATLAAPSEWSGTRTPSWPRRLTPIVVLAAAAAPVATYLRLR